MKASSSSQGYSQELVGVDVSKKQPEITAKYPCALRKKKGHFIDTQRAVHIECIQLEEFEDKITPVKASPPPIPVTSQSFLPLPFIIIIIIITLCVARAPHEQLPSWQISRVQHRIFSYGHYAVRWVSRTYLSLLPEAQYL